jgi:hypothetical protein
MRLREGETVSSLAPVVDSDTNGGAVDVDAVVAEPAEEPSDETVVSGDDEPSSE